MSTETLVDENVVTQKVKEHTLVVYNDDVNTFDHVINALIKVCRHTTVQAEQCTYLIHYKGKCDVQSGEYSQLEKMCTQLLNRGISSEIH